MPLLPSVLLFALAAGAAGAPPVENDQLKATLEKLDAASRKFTSAEAQVHKVIHTALIPGDETQDGRIYFKREGGSTEMGYVTGGSDPETVNYKAGTVRVYRPNTKHCDVVKAAGLDTYLTLGFGGSGTDLAKVWDITDKGPETIGGVVAEKLELIPKDAKVKANIKLFTIWVDLARAVSVKQVLLQPTNDTQTALYTNIQYNKTVDTKPFAIQSPCK
jgi:outer membrane lipoprotein-sorting protein